MCDARSLSGLRQAVSALAAEFDAAHLDGPAARSAMEHAAAIENAAAALKARIARRLGEVRGYRERGLKSAAHDLALASGTTVAQATAAIEAASRLDHHPRLAAAASSGSLSAPQVSLVAAALAANPGADEGALVEAAGRQSLGELRDTCDRLKAEGDRDGEARHRRIHDERFLRRAGHADGSASLTLRDTPDVIAGVMSAIAPARVELFAAARRSGRRERSEALDADALVATVCRQGGGTRSANSAAKVLVRVDLDALLRGYPATGEVCEIAGYGPVAVSAVRDMIATGNPFLAAIATRGERVTGVAHLGRAPRAVQGSALEWINPICARQGCPNAIRLERDHRVDWAHTRITLVDWMDRLCEHDHDLKTRRGWALVAGRGKRPMVPPGHPDHPGRVGGGQREGAAASFDRANPSTGPPSAA